MAEQEFPRPSMGLSFPIGGLGMVARHKRAGKGREGLRPTFHPVSPGPSIYAPTHSSSSERQGSRRCGGVLAAGDAEAKVEVGTRQLDLRK